MARTLVLLTIALPAILAGQQPDLPSSTVLNHVALVDVVSSTTRRDMAVVICRNRITAVGRASETPIPAGARVLDLTGKFVIPGLVDMHNHLGTGAAIPGLPAPGAAARNPRANLTQMVALGFTTVFATAYPEVDEFVELRRAAADDVAVLWRRSRHHRGRRPLVAAAL
jgi:predicted amidohydrolase YtcJ